MTIEELLAHFQDGAPPIGTQALVEGLFGVLLAFLLARVLVVVIARVRASPHLTRESLHSVVMLAVGAAFLMAVIGNSVARAFGLIGAMSLVRFRNAVKETDDLVALFLAIAIGAACGVGAFALATGGTALICLLWLALSGRLALHRGASAVVGVTVGKDGHDPERLLEVVARHAREAVPLAVLATDDGVRVEYRVRLDGEKAASALVSGLTEHGANAFVHWLER